MAITKSRRRKPYVVPAKVGQRLKQLRLAYGWRQKRMAKHTGISPPSWSKYESGQELMSVYHAAVIECRTGATLDWIYVGKVDAMPVGLLNRINQVGEADNGD